MADSIANVKILVKEQGLAAVEASSAKVANNFERANKASSRLGGSAAITSTPKYSSKAAEMADGIDYGRARAGVGTGAAGRDFAKQSQGLGGLVHLYATFAANIFAVGAAYEALNKAAQTERLIQASKMMSVQVGANLNGISKNLVEASGHALSFTEAMQFTNIGTSAGLAGKQIESLTKIARGAASALGRDANDSIRRIIQGTAKQEQEILDELGIFVKSKQAFDKYAKEIGVKADDLTGRQRTQAYANEVERLGEKWKAFAEIDDPFSRFTATGKNALVELLNSINKVFKPLLSYLADSKDGIQGIILLVSTILAKRALPELGGVFNNLFNYDKIAAEANKTKMIRDLDSQLDIIKTRSKAISDELAKMSTGSSINDARSSVYNRTSGLKNVAGVSAGINNIGLASSLVGTLKNPFNSDTIKKNLEDKLFVEKAITDNLNKQLVSEKNRDKVLSQLVQRGLVEKGSTAGNLVLTEQLKVVASNITTDLTQRAAVMASNNALQKEGLLLTEKELALQTQKTSIGALGTKAYSPAKAQIAEAVSSAGKNSSILFAQGLTGILPGLKEVALGIRNVVAGMTMAASVGTTFSGVLGILRLGLTGIIGVASAAIMPVMLLITAWSLFGDTIKEWLGISSKSTKLLEEQKEKLTQYNDTLLISATTISKVNEERQKAYGSGEEYALVLTREATAIKSEVDAYEELVKQKIEKTKQLELEEKVRKGLIASVDAYYLTELKNSGRISENSQKNLNSIIQEMNYISRQHEAKQGMYADDIAYETRMNELRAYSIQYRKEALRVTEQELAQIEKINSAGKTLEKAFEDYDKANKGNKDLKLNTDYAVAGYESVKKIVEGSTASTVAYTLSYAKLTTEMKGNAKASALLAVLGKTLSDIHAKSGGNMETYAKLLKESGPALEAAFRAIGTALDKPAKSSGKIKEYSDIAKDAIRALGVDIELTKDRVHELDLETKNITSINARASAVRGYTSAEEDAAIAVQDSLKAQLDYNASIQRSAEALAKEIYKSSSSTEDKAKAYERFHQERVSAERVQEIATQTSNIKQENFAIAREVTKITKEYDKQLKLLDRQADNKSRALDMEEALYELSQVSRVYTDEEKFLRIPEKEQALRKETFEITRAGHERDIKLTQLELKYVADINALVAKRLPEEDMIAEAIRLSEERTTAEEAANAAYKGRIDLIAIHTQSTLAEANKSAAEESRQYWSDALEAAFNSGKGFFKSLWDTIKNTLKKQVLKVGVSAVMGTFGITDAIAATSGTAGSPLGILSSLSSIPTAIKSFGSTVASFGASASAFAEGVSLGWAGTAASPSVLAGASMTGTTGSLAAGSQFGALLANPYTWIAAAVIAALTLEGGETRSGGQYVYSKDGQDVIDPNTGKVVKASNNPGMIKSSGPSGGSLDGTEDIIKAAPATINSLLELVGSSAFVAAYQAGVETSNNDRGGVYAGGTLSTGATFGESGKGSNYSGSLYDPMYGFELNSEEAAKYLAQDIQASSIEALQAATDIPKVISDLLKDYSARPEEKTQEAIAAKAVENTSILNSIAGIAAFQKSLKTLPFNELKESSFDASMSLLKASAGAQQAGEALDTYLARGMQNLQTNLTGYYDNFYSDTEKTVQLTSNLSDALKDQNIVLPVSNKNVRDWYRGEIARLGAMDLSIEANAKAYTSVLALQESIKGLSDIADAYADRFASDNEKLLSSKNTVNQALDALDAQAAPIGGLTAAMEKARITSLNSKESFNRLVNSITGTDSASVKLRYGLMALGPAFADVVDAIDGLVQGIIDSIDSSIRTMRFDVLDEAGRYAAIDLEGKQNKDALLAAAAEDNIYKVAESANALISNLNEAWGLMTDEQKAANLTWYTTELASIKQLVIDEGATAADLRKADTTELATTIATENATATTTALEPVAISIQAAATSMNSAADSMSNVVGALTGSVSTGAVATASTSTGSSDIINLAESMTKSIEMHQAASLEVYNKSFEQISQYIKTRETIDITARNEEAKQVASSMADMMSNMIQAALNGVSVNLASAASSLNNAAGKPIDVNVSLNVSAPSGSEVSLS